MSGSSFTRLQQQTKPGYRYSLGGRCFLPNFQSCRIFPPFFSSHYVCRMCSREDSGSRRSLDIDIAWEEDASSPIFNPVFSPLFSTPAMSAGCAREKYPAADKAWISILLGRKMLLPQFSNLPIGRDELSWPMRGYEPLVPTRIEWYAFPAVPPPNSLDSRPASASRFIGAGPVFTM